MPSAVGQEEHWNPAPWRSRALRISAWTAGSVAAVGCLCVLLVAIVVFSGWGTERLRAAAEKAISSALGMPVMASMGPAGITFDGTRLIALELQDVGVRTDASDKPMIEAGSMHFGLRLLPLLLGDVQLGGARISDARIDVGAMPSVGSSDWTKIVRDETGLVDPDRIVAVLFEHAHALMSAVESGSAREVDLENVSFLVPEGTTVRILKIVTGNIAETGSGTLEIQADADIDGRRLTIAGQAVRDPVSGLISAIDLSVAGDPVPIDENAPPRESLTQLGGFSISIKGNEGAGSEPASLNVSASLQKSVLDLGARGAFTGNMSLDTTLAAGTNKIEINRLSLQTGRNSLDFNGAVGPRPPTGKADDRPVYRYELLSTKTVAAPDASPEPPLDFIANVAGIFDPQRQVLTAENIAIKAASGELVGSGQAEFVEGLAPGLTLTMAIDGMPVAATKQLWPWFVGPKSRAWVFDHVFGGTVAEGRIRFKVQPGRLGNGVPLSGEEVSARFDLKDTRFDTTGQIPPVRDADGVVNVQGNDFDIALSTGTAYLTSGPVKASNATLTVKSANQPPVIGKLVMDVEGSAEAVAELATYEPISFLKRVALAPGDFSGNIKGHVTADIPFQKGTDPKTLDWLVALNFDGLALAKSFDGQKVSDAAGTITIGPEAALVSGKGKLNGVPAEFEITEPLRPAGPERARKVTLVLDDNARNALAPGLADLVSGPSRVAVDIIDGKRSIVADLSGAQLDIPWAGWSKGAGIAATAKFSLEKDGDNTSLSGFELSGKSFALKGSVSLARGALSSASFDTVSLNRGDNVAVWVKRNGNVYAVVVKGRALDARPIIKRVTSGGGGDAVAGKSSVALKLDVDSLTGFNGETLAGVKLAYSGAGGSLDGLTANATTNSGNSVAVTNDSGDGKRTLQLQSGDAGAILKFLDIYDHAEGGEIRLALSGSGGGAMAGQIDARNFWVVSEPKLASIVSTTPQGDERSLNQAVRRDIDTSRVQFDRGYAQIEKGDGYLRIKNGVLRGPLIGSTFQGTLYDQNAHMDMTGTFMPAYGLNRLFGELPLIGVILGNGRDRGLIGVTYKLEGDVKSPRLQINPLSVMAPGIFRSIFEFQ